MEMEKYSSATVAICGLGGLGSNIAIALARAGVYKLILIDFDKVDSSNLHRQQYKAKQVGMYKTEALTENLREIVPDIELEVHTKRITDENCVSLLRGADIICEAFDNPEAKAMLVNMLLTELPEKYVVAASGMAGLETANNIQTRKLTNHFYICGDEVSEVTKDKIMYSTRVMICAAHQAHMVLRIISGKLNP